MLNKRRQLVIYSQVLALTCALSLGLPGCGDQVDSDYPGEVVASLSGVATVEGTPPAGDSFVHLLWFRTVGGSDTTVVDKVPIQSNGSAIGFTFNFHSAPPSGAFNSYTEGGKHPNDVSVALGYLVAMRTGFDSSKQEDGGEKEPWHDSHIAGLLLGLATQHVLVYVNKDVKPNTFPQFLLNDTLKTGYHLMEVQSLSEMEKKKILACKATASDDAAIRACGTTADKLVVAPQGMSTIIPLEIPNDPTTLRWPQWVDPHDYRDTIR